MIRRLRLLWKLNLQIVLHSLLSSVIVFCPWVRFVERRWSTQVPEQLQGVPVLLEVLIAYQSLFKRYVTPLRICNRRHLVYKNAKWWTDVVGQITNVQFDILVTFSCKLCLISLFYNRSIHDIKPNWLIACFIFVSHNKRILCPYHKSISIHLLKFKNKHRKPFLWHDR